MQAAIGDDDMLHLQLQSKLVPPVHRDRRKETGVTHRLALPADAVQVGDAAAALGFLGAPALDRVQVRARQLQLLAQHRHLPHLCAEDHLSLIPADM